MSRYVDPRPQSKIGQVRETRQRNQLRRLIEREVG
jgi:hypothetical protein